MPKEQARKAASKAPKPPKTAKKPPAKASSAKSGKKKPESVKNSQLVPSLAELGPQFSPYAIEIGIDVVKKASLRYRTMFPKKFNAIKAAMTPVDVMLFAMHHELHRNQYAKAARHAKDVASYIHPRLSHIHATGDRGKLDDITDEGLALLLSVIEEKVRDRGAIDGRAIASPGSGAGDADQTATGKVALFDLSG